MHRNNSNLLLMNNPVNKCSLFVWPGAIPYIEDGTIRSVVRIITSSKVDMTKQYTRIGYVGDLWYILEDGRMEDDNLYVRKDGSAALHKDHKTTEVIPNKKYIDIPERHNVKAQDMPVWAARYWCRIVDVSYPIKVQELSDDQIMSLGIKQINRNQFEYAGDMYSATTFAEAFKIHWNIYYGKWKRVKGANGDFFASYPYDDDLMPMPNNLVNTARGMKFLNSPNPFVTVYQFEKFMNK